MISDIPPLVIADDRGGLIVAYEALARELRKSGRKVQIRGFCASACTILLRLPAEQICAEPQAAFWFHEAGEAVAGPGRKPRSDESTSALMDRYPEPIRAWLREAGGLRPSWTVLRGAEMRQFVRACE